MGNISHRHGLDNLCHSLRLLSIHLKIYNDIMVIFINTQSLSMLDGTVNIPTTVYISTILLSGHFNSSIVALVTADDIVALLWQVVAHQGGNQLEIQGILHSVDDLLKLDLCWAFHQLTNYINFQGICLGAVEQGQLIPLLQLVHSLKSLVMDVFVVNIIICHANTSFIFSIWYYCTPEREFLQ